MARELFLVQGSDEARWFLNEDVPIVPPVAPSCPGNTLVGTISGIISTLASMYPPNKNHKVQRKTEETVKAREREVTEVTFVAGTGQAFSHLTITVTSHLLISQMKTLELREV